MNKNGNNDHFIFIANIDITIKEEQLCLNVSFNFSDLAPGHVQHFQPVCLIF